jgi:HYDIN/CFA65/VesB family protein
MRAVPISICHRLRGPVFPLSLSIILLFIFSAAVSYLPEGKAAVQPFSGDSCDGATIIAPAALPFSEDSTTEGATNDVDPGLGSCAQGQGPDVVYSFTPAQSGIYSLGVTPFDSGFDTSLYVVTDCSNPAGTCVAGANANGFNKGESLTVSLNAGTRYFIVIDSPSAVGAGRFHFTLRSGTPANDACATPIVIETSRLPFTASGTTIGATNNLNPGTPCLRSGQSGTGPDVVYQFTPADTQSYVVTITPVGNFDVTAYIVTGCPALTSCSSSDIGGAGDAEVVRRRLDAGTTYFIIVDGFQGDAGDFIISVEPTLPQVPDAPSNLVASAISDTRVDLIWVDNSNNELGFRIERSLDGFNFVEIGSVGSNVTSFSDTTVFANTTFFYRVMAFNNFGNSSPSNIADVTTPEPPRPQIPLISVSPDLVDFGTVGPGLPATRTVTITNNGGVDLIITAISDPNPPFSIVNKPALPITVQPGQSTTITVAFASTGSQVFLGSFTIQSNAANAALVTVNLRATGTGAPVPNLEINPLLVDFPGGAGSATVQIRNTGDADLVIASLSNAVFPFTVAGAPATPITLAPGQGFILTIGFSPTTQGVFNGSFQVVTNDPDQLLTVVRLRGTSTASNELLKLRAPTLVTAIAGATTTLNVIAVNGTNTDIRLEATAVSGGTFTDRGNGRGDLVLTPAASASGNVFVTFTARDSASRIKTLQSVITIVASANTHRVQVSWTAPETAPGGPTDALATDQSITALAATQSAVEAEGVEPAVAAGLVGYVIYRSQSAGVAVTLSNIVGVVPASQTAFSDVVPAPPGSGQTFFYRVTALYQTGTESAVSNETSNAPRIVGLRFKSKGIRFQAANSNVAVGAVLIVDGRETFALQRSGEFIIVDKNARSTPGNQRPKDIFTNGSTHSVQVRNPNGATSLSQTLTR